MYGLRGMLEAELSRMKELEQMANMQLKGLPKGSVRISVSNNQIQYYYRCEGNNDKNGKYLHRDEVALAYQISQRKYDEGMLKLLKRRIRQLETLLSDYQDDEMEKVYYRETALRRKLITPLEKTWEKLQTEWIAQEFKIKPFNDSAAEIYADKGHRVRSKSEKILADFFYRNNIPYHYEKPLYLEGYGTVYPDFTFLSRKNKTEIYWEHEGMMDNANYVNKVLKKHEAYEKNGIYIGDRLIITQETTEYILKLLK